MWRGAGGILAPLGVFLSITIVFVLAVWKRTAHALIIAVGASATILAWAVVLRTPGAADRHFINGLATYFAMIGMALVFMARGERPRRIVAQIGVAALALIWGAHALARTNDSLATARVFAKYENFDPAHHRNLASLDAVRLAMSPGFQREVLVDQHSYIDLRLFRTHGIGAKYINMDNIGSQLAALDTSRKYVVVFARGSYNAKLEYWPKSHWETNLKQRYDAYQMRLLSLPVAKHYEGPPQAVLSGAPVAPRDDIFVSVITSSPR